MGKKRFLKYDTDQSDVCDASGCIKMPEIPEVPDNVVVKKTKEFDPGISYSSAITFCGGMFIAPNSASVYMSKNGFTWTKSEIGGIGNRRIPAYGNDTFVLTCGERKGMTAAYCDNYNTWNTSSLPSSRIWSNAVYGGGKFVAVATESDAAAYSIDGVTWTAATLPRSGNWKDPVYGGGKFVAVAAGSDAAAYSIDGVTWTAATLPSSGNWLAPVYGGGKFVTVAAGSDAAAYSIDGVTWTAATLPSSGDWQCIVYGREYITVKPKGIAYSTDGITWNDEGATFLNSYTDRILYANGRYIALSTGNSDSSTTSYDGKRWSSVHDGTEWRRNIRAQGYGAGLIFGYNNVAGFFYSADGYKGRNTYDVLETKAGAELLNLTYAQLRE